MGLRGLKGSMHSHLGPSFYTNGKPLGAMGIVFYKNILKI
jgi:hypothetical protein